MANKNIQIQDVDGNNLYPVSLIKVTYAQLKSLRDKSNLMPGMQYRITDYQCTTTQEDTQSAGHQFDIIVTADSKNKLNEKARAILHDSDTYFADCNLSAWQLWYCLDNDTNRFAWADATNGKGVIYRMIDEWNNDCPYDFKNIQFKRYKIIKAKQSNLIGTYLGLKSDNAEGIETDTNNSIWCYTFTAQISIKQGDNFVIPNNAPYIDGSLESPYQHMSDENTSTYHDNKIGSYLIVYDEDEVKTLCGKYYLPNNVFIGYFESITNASNDDYCYAYCSYNITLENNCNSNSFGNNCNNNSFENNCNHNSFGYNCNSNSFGEDCNSNSFGKDCDYNRLGVTSSGNKLGAYYQYNKFENGVQNVEFSGVGTNDNKVQNYHIKQGMSFTSRPKHTIIAKAGLNYELSVAKKTDGTIIEYNEADLIPT